jgi:hypothetical protein
MLKLNVQRVQTSIYYIYILVSFIYIIQYDSKNVKINDVYCVFKYLNFYNNGL